MLLRRTFLRVGAGAVALPAVARWARAQTYPTRSVHIVVGFPPGFATDIAARLIAQALSQRLGQPFVVDNRPGAGSNIAAEAVARTSPDGYTLLGASVANTINATLYRNLAFDFIRDLTPVAFIDRVPNVVVVNPAVPAATLAAFIAYAKANPGKINYASGGNGSASNVAGELFKMMAGVDLLHVPYRASFITDLLAGQVQASFPPVPPTIGHIRDGKLRALGVTSAARSDALAGVPAVAEVLPGYEATTWHGIAAPKNTPVEIVARLNKEINLSLADPAVQAKFANVGSETAAMTSDEFEKFIQDETAKWAKVIAFAGLMAE
ncbi:MAG TPA: tripartite tricarboxylate transporter substrate binding protein [Xanthobacteraceae bacterium]|nr:tripartite tricarboxylate transporter substrate binding protein [Xanthobacteraceae bacterium]